MGQPRTLVYTRVPGNLGGGILIFFAELEGPLAILPNDSSDSPDKRLAAFADRLDHRQVQHARDYRPQHIADVGD